MTDAEVSELKSAGEQLASDIPSDTRKSVFSTTDLPQVKILNIFSKLFCEMGN